MTQQALAANSGLLCNTGLRQPLEPVVDDLNVCFIENTSVILSFQPQLRLLHDFMFLVSNCHAADEMSRIHSPTGLTLIHLPRSPNLYLTLFLVQTNNKG